MASSHRRVLQQVCDLLTCDNPECGILLAGSMMRGTERPESDIDLFVVVPDIERLAVALGRVKFATDHVRVIEATVEGIPVALTCFDVHLLSDMAAELWRNYLFARAKRLCDPSGAVRQSQDAINAWFAAHPDVEALWTEQERRHAEVKVARRRGEDASLQFPTWETFADHVTEFVRQRGIR